MKLIAQLQILPGQEQSQALEETLRVANAACNFLSQVAWDNQTFNKRELQKQTYHELRVQFPIRAQVAIRCIAKVCDAYRTAFELHRQRIQEVHWANEQRTREGKDPMPLPEVKPCQFRDNGSLPFDDRILTYQEWCVSIWTVVGRTKVPFVCGEPQKELLHSRQGESDLVFRNGKWFLLATCHQDAPLPELPQGVIGVDMGLENIATTSQGKNYSGDKVKALRKKLREHRRRLQKCGTKSAKRRLKKLSKRQERFTRNTNHCIAKEIMRDARASHKALSLEDLAGIRKRTSSNTPAFRLGREMRWLLGNWAFAQLRSCIEYKARSAVCGSFMWTHATPAALVLGVGTAPKRIERRRISSVWSAVSRTTLMPTPHATSHCEGIPSGPQSIGLLSQALRLRDKLRPSWAGSLTIKCPPIGKIIFRPVVGFDAARDFFLDQSTRYGVGPG